MPGTRNAYGKAFAYPLGKRNMKTMNQLWMLLLVMVVTFSSCELVGDIFQAGFWTAIIVIVLVIALIIWLFSRFRR